MGISLETLLEELETFTVDYIDYYLLCSKASDDKRAKVKASLQILIANLKGE